MLKSIRLKKNTKTNLKNYLLRYTESDSVNKVMAFPDLPALPVRPGESR